MTSVPGFSVLNASQYLEQTVLGGLTVSLVASGDGTEIIHHRLSKSTMWTIYPSDGWDALEFVWVLSGEIDLQAGRDVKQLRPGDKVSVQGLTDDLVFTAVSDAEFLYVCSQPVFMYYSSSTQNLKELAQAIECKDGYTANHCSRIMELSVAVGKKMGLSAKQISDLNLGGFLHDVGKTRVPIEILNKPGKFEPAEWEIMKQHARFGREIIDELGLPFLHGAAVIVEQHHERFDGSGYPYGIAGNDIKIESAIVAVVDSFDAMVSNRVYKPGSTVGQAISELLRCRGSLYRSDVVDAFLSLPESILVENN